MKNNRTFLEKLLDGAEVEWKPLNKIVTTITAPVKLKREMYCSTGSTPIIDQGEKFIAGYTDENFEAIPSNEYIIFGDHSEHIKYVNFSFIQGADGLKILKPKEDNAKYIYYAFQNFYVKELNYKRHWSSAKETLIPLPPPTVQTEIVRILDALTALTSELTSELTLRRKQYEYYRETLLLPDNLEQLNTEGAKKKLSDVVNIYLGLTYTPTYVENGVKFISAQNTSNDFLDLSNTKFISREEFEKSTSNAKPKRGDILFTRVGSNLGHPVIVDTDEDLCIFVSLGFLRVKDKNILNSYIKHWMNTNLFWKQVEKNVHGSAKVNLNTGWLKDFEIYIPTLKEQQRIVSILDKFETLTNSINKGLPLAIEQSQKRYEYYRELLLNFPGRE